MKPSAKKTILLLVTMGLTMMSMHFDAPCDGGPLSAGFLNDLLVGHSFEDSSCDDRAGDDTGNSCESGCQDCNLACCAGSAMIPPTAQTADSAPNYDGRLATTTAEVSWVDPDRLFHPPRA